VSRTALEVAPTATMLIRFRVATNIVGETPADGWLILFPLRLDFAGAFFARITFPEKWRVRRAWRPDPDAFPVEVCPRSEKQPSIGSGENP
jgi:hypothetical protein